MTETETILNAALDADPSDQVARRALADYYIEIGDARGYGYKALAELDKNPHFVKLSDFETWHWHCYGCNTESLVGYDAIYVGYVAARQVHFASRCEAEEWAVRVLLTQGIVDSHGIKYP